MVLDSAKILLAVKIFASLRVAAVSAASATAD
jgi:hypothetical protein